MNELSMDDLTEDNLDRVARTLQKDSLPMQDKQKQWNDEFMRKAHALIDMFEDGPEVILQCKVADHMTRMMEKITHNITAAGTQLKRERRDMMRDDVGIEITQNKVQQIDEKLELMRQQYYIANVAYKLMRYKVRTEVIGKTGVNWGQYIPADEMSRVKRVKLRKGALTMEQYSANKQDFWSYARDTGLVDMGRDDSHATSTDR